MVDELKHLDGHSDEIRTLVETLLQNHLLRATHANQYCPHCVAIALLEGGPPLQRHLRALL